MVHGAKYIFPIPDGLKELSGDIIREVLRHQPEHINGFIADYLEAMLTVRDNAREAGVVVFDIYQQGHFLNEIFRIKDISREQAGAYATVIQAAWRGYVVRRKLAEYLKKKKKFEEEKEKKRSLKIDELLAGLKVSYDEATRAAGVIQTAYKESKRGKWIPGDFGEVWVGEAIPFGQRLREGDKAMGRFDRWEKKDFGDFFEMDEAGAIKYVWPRVGQLLKVATKEMPPDVDVVEFFAMRDLNGQEQYSYLIKTQQDSDTRGSPIGFLVPLPKMAIIEATPEIEFINPQLNEKMGHYRYIFTDDVERDDLQRFEELLNAQAKTAPHHLTEINGEFDYDPNWVLPRVLIRIKQEFLLPTDDEIKFISLPEVACEQEKHTFRAETLEQSAKIIRHILRNQCLGVLEGLKEAANMQPYRLQETGRIFPVENFITPQFVQKINIVPEFGSEEEDATSMAQFTYVFVPLNYGKKAKLPKPEPLMSIPMTRFQGYHSDYKGSSELDSKVFIMGPKVTTPNGKPFTHESLFWDEFGLEAWYQLMHDLTDHEVEIEDEEVEFEGEFEEELPEMEGEDAYSEKTPPSSRGNRPSQPVPKTVRSESSRTGGAEGEIVKKHSAPPSEHGVEPGEDEKGEEGKLDGEKGEAAEETEPVQQTESERVEETDEENANDVSKLERELNN